MQKACPKMLYKESSGYMQGRSDIPIALGMLRCLLSGKPVLKWPVRLKVCTEAPYSPSISLLSNWRDLIWLRYLFQSQGQYVFAITICTIDMFNR